MCKENFHKLSTDLQTLNGMDVFIFVRIYTHKCNFQKLLMRIKEKLKEGSDLYKNEQQH